MSGAQRIKGSRTEIAFYVQLGARIAEARRAQKWSQRQLAKILGFTNGHISYVEGGHRRLPAYEVVRIAQELRVTVTWLTGESA